MSQASHLDAARALWRGSSPLYLGGALSVTLVLLQQLTTARWLGAADYGRFATVIGSGAFLLIVFEFRTAELLTKLFADARGSEELGDRECARIAGWLAAFDVFRGLCCALWIALLAAPLATHLLNQPDAAGLVRLYAASLPFAVVAEGALSAVLPYFGRFQWLARKSVANAALRLAAVSGAVAAGFGLRGALAGLLIAEAVHAAVMVALAITALRRELRTTPALSLQRPALLPAGRRMLGPLWTSAAIRGFQLSVFVPALAFFSTPAQVGLFRSGLDIATTTTKLVTPLSMVLAPSIIRQASRTPGQLLRAALQATAGLALLVTPLVLAIVWLGPSLLPRLFGPSYAEVAPIASLLSAAYGLAAVLIWMRPALVGLGRVREQNRLGLIATALSWVAIAVCVPAYGALGAASVLALFFAGLYGACCHLFYRSLPEAQREDEMPVCTSAP